MGRTTEAAEAGSVKGSASGQGSTGAGAGNGGANRLGGHITRFRVRVGEQYYTGHSPHTGRSVLGPQRDAHIFYSVDEADRQAQVMGGVVQGVVHEARA